MPGIDKARVPTKHTDKLPEDVLMETHLVMESPIVPSNQFLKCHAATEAFA